MDSDSRESVESDDFDLESEMETGIVISEERNGYRATCEGKRIAAESCYSDLITLVEEYMDTSNYWPNVFQVNDHGNVTQIVIGEDGETTEVRSWV